MISLESSNSVGLSNSDDLSQCFHLAKSRDLNVFRHVEFPTATSKKKFTENFIEIIKDQDSLRLDNSLDIKKKNIQSITKQCILNFKRNSQTQKSDLTVYKCIAIYLINKYFDVEGVHLEQLLKPAEAKQIANDIFDRYTLNVAVTLSTLQKSNSRDEENRKAIAKLEKYLNYYQISNPDELLGKAKKAFEEKNYDLAIPLHKNNLEPALLATEIMILLGDDDEFIKKMPEMELLEALATPDIKGYTALYFAAAFNKYSIVMKISQFAPTHLKIKNKRGRTPLHRICRDWDKKNLENYFKFLYKTFAAEEFEQLIDEKDDYGRRPIHIAAIVDNVAAINILLSYKAQIDATDEFRRTPLHLAASYDAEKSVESLCKAGANKNAQDGITKFKRTPLHLASFHNSIKTIKQLLKYQADICSVDYENNTPFHEAAKANSSAALKLLIQASPPDSPQMANKHKSTPLHHAAYYGSSESVKILLDVGVATDLKDEDGRTPVMVSVKKNSSLNNIIGQDNASNRKIAAAVYLINHDQNIFLRKHTLKHQNIFSDRLIKSLQDYADLTVLEYFEKLYTFFKKNDDKLLNLFNDINAPKNLVHKLLVKKDPDLIAQFLNDFSQFYSLLESKLIEILENSTENEISYYSDLCRLIEKSHPEFIKKEFLCAKDIYSKINFNEDDSICLEQIKKSIALVKNILNDCDKERSSDFLFLIGLAYASNFNSKKSMEVFKKSLDYEDSNRSELLKSSSRALYTILKLSINQNEISVVKNKCFQDFDFTKSYYNLSSPIKTAIRVENIELLDYFVDGILNDKMKVASILKDIFLFSLSLKDFHILEKIHKKWNDSEIFAKLNLDEEEKFYLVSEFLENQSDQSDQTKDAFNIKKLFNDWKIELTEDTKELLEG